MQHNQLTFAAEYCRARRIPYRIKGEALFIDRKQVCFSLYNLTYVGIIEMIDIECIYDDVTTFFVSRSNPWFNGSGAQKEWREKWKV